MIPNLRIVLLDIPQLEDYLEDQYTYIHHVQGLNGIIRFLIENPADVVILPAKIHSMKKLEKIFNSCQVPFLLVGEKNRNSRKFHFCDQMGNVEKTLLDMSRKIESGRIERENGKLQYVMSHLEEFTSSVVHTTKDLFVSETKAFFNNNFKLASSHWVEVKATSSKLPPILKIKQELEKQQVDQGSLISDLDQYTMEIVAEENYQLWKNRAGEYLSMIWVHEEENVSYCLILNRVQIRNRLYFQSFLDYFITFLGRRWDLCRKVGGALQQVYRDSLTNLYNQRFLNEVLAKKIEEHKRYNTPFSVLFIDVDHFKRVNDSLGHVIGSGVLGEMGDLLQGQIRNSDYAFRYGGDEFIILLSHTEGNDAVIVAERVRAAVENHQFEVNGVNVRITVSIGLAFFPKHAQSAEEIIRIADEAMYYGKNKSRNIVYKAS